MQAKGEKEMIITLQVKMPLPHGATPADAVRYAREALNCWSGSLMPPQDNEDGDPMFGFDKATVRLIKEKK
jgi:hypothetical protein